MPFTPTANSTSDRPSPRQAPSSSHLSPSQDQSRTRSFPHPHDTSPATAPRFARAPDEATPSRRLPPVALSAGRLAGVARPHSIPRFDRFAGTLGLTWREDGN